MFRARRVDVLNMTHLLKLAAGDEALKFHRGSMRIYKGGFYSAIGDIAPDHLLNAHYFRRRWKDSCCSLDIPEVAQNANRKFIHP